MNPALIFGALALLLFVGAKRPAPRPDSAEAADARRRNAARVVADFTKKGAK